MSSLQKTSGGYRIQFRLAGKTRQLSLPGAKRKAAESTQRHLDELISCQRHGIAPQDSTLEWLQRINSDIRQSLVAFGLANERAANGTPLIDLFDEFCHRRFGLSQSTQANDLQLRRKLFACFGKRPADKMTRADADDFRQFCLRVLKVNENTTRKRCGQASTFFRWLVRREVVKFNIFDDVPKAVGSAIERKQLITADVIRKVLEQAPNAEWRALICLGRWGGLRIPSEAFGMRWEDIDWEQNRILIRSPKTEHQHKPVRVIPLFPELLEPLRELFELAEPGDTWVIPMLRQKSGNVRTPLQKMLLRAKVEPWPLLWNSMRSTRETELAATFPIHVVCEWMGNTVAVASRHYLKASDEDFQRASRAEDSPKPIATNNHIEPQQPPAQKHI